MAWAIVYYSGVGSREPQCGNINSFHASVFLARQPMETGCPYPLNEDDPPVTRLVAMAPACHASQCPSLSPTFIRQHLPDNRMRWYSTRRQALGSDMERKHLPWSFHARFRSHYLQVGKGRKRDVCQQDHQPHCQIRSPLIHHGADYRQPHHQQPSSRPSTYPLSEWPMDTSHLFLRDRELTAHANIYNIYHLYLIFVLFICEWKFQP